MVHRHRIAQPRVFSAVNWAYTTLPLLALALPHKAFAVSEDDFSFDAEAPEPTLDLIDIAPQMVRHFSSTDHHMGRNLQVGTDGSTWVAPPDAADAAAAEPAAQSDQIIPDDDIAG